VAGHRNGPMKLQNSIHCQNLTTLPFIGKLFGEKNVKEKKES
jgi:hypothetical protein